ncbi:hypothetical protein FWG86_02595 [Candidatus Saccharibacteria bacterium]|nr:hypothetical protein [Candidatus Saccharibacteria bacterium]
MKNWPRAGDDGSFWSVRFWSPADWVSNVRAFLAPVLAVVCVLDGLGLTHWWWLVWAVVGLSDKLDGGLAAWLGSSKRGPTNDEQSDKICIFAAFLACMVLGLAPGYLLVVMMLRDLLITLIRSRMRENGDTSLNSARQLGKLKTVFQFLMVVLAFCPAEWFVRAGLDGLQGPMVWCLALAATSLSLISGWQYFQMALERLGNK